MADAARCQRNIRWVDQQNSNGWSLTSALSSIIPKAMTQIEADFSHYIDDPSTIKTGG